MYPENFRYTKEHEWVLVEGDTGTSGSPITPRRNWATSSMSTCPKSGRNIEQGKSLGSVESVKAVSDVYSPVSGEVARGQRHLWPMRRRS